MSIVACTITRLHFKAFSAIGNISSPLPFVGEDAMSTVSSGQSFLPYAANGTQSPGSLLSHAVINNHSISLGQFLITDQSADHSVICAVRADTYPENNDY